MTKKDSKKKTFKVYNCQYCKDIKYICNDFIAVRCWNCGFKKVKKKEY